MKYITIAFCILISLSNLTHAEILKYQFSGYIDRVGSEIGDGFTVNETLSGSFEIDTESLFQGIANTRYDATNLMVTIGGDYIITGSGGSMNFSEVPWGESIQVGFSNYGGSNEVAGDLVNGATLGRFELSFDWTTTDPLYTQALPLEIDTLSSTDKSNLLYNTDPGLDGAVSLKITSMSAVPVPAAAWLFGSALIGLVGLRRK
jgi:hypothetical protein